MKVNNSAQVFQMAVILMAMELMILLSDALNNATAISLFLEIMKINFQKVQTILKHKEESLFVCLMVKEVEKLVPYYLSF